ncbi:MAG: hypothetical protein H6807_17790 [Planctomycetes bacterium]|nr:hypothetical protein [Planctomycetota bacterium]
MEPNQVTSPREGRIAGWTGFLSGLVAALLGSLLAMLACVPFVDEGGADLDWVLLALFILRTVVLIRFKARSLVRADRPRHARGFRIGVSMVSLADIGALVATMVRNASF